MCTVLVVIISHQFNVLTLFTLKRLPFKNGLNSSNLSRNHFFSFLAQFENMKNLRFDELLKGSVHQFRSA